MAAAGDRPAQRDAKCQGADGADRRNARRPSGGSNSGEPATAAWAQSRNSLCDGIGQPTTALPSQPALTWICVSGRRYAMGAFVSVAAQYATCIHAARGRYGRPPIDVTVAVLPETDGLRAPRCSYGLRQPPVHLPRTTDFLITRPPCHPFPASDARLWEPRVAEVSVRSDATGACRVGASVAYVHR